MRFWVSLVVSCLAALAVAALSGCTREAPPMSGVCHPILAKSYSGADANSPTRECLWSGRRWECTHYSGTGFSSDWWRCEDVGAAPAEAPK